jgi:hypothetical protein
MRRERPRANQASLRDRFRSGLEPTRASLRFLPILGRTRLRLRVQRFQPFSDIIPRSLACAAVLTVCTVDSQEGQ